MINLYYRGYVIHEDIPSICYTIFGRRPQRMELGSSVTAREGMQWVDQHLAGRAAAQWKDTGAAPRKRQGQTRSAQPAML